MNRGLRHVAWGFAACFILLSLGLAYWQVIAAENLQKNPANQRLVRLEERVLRGGILDRNGEVLAQSISESGKKRRVYPRGEIMEPLLGYATLQHGSAGLEGSLADWLLGMKNPTFLQAVTQFLELSRQGDDVILTIDTALQQAAYDALKGKTGAAVIINPKNGEVLALVSQPSFNPEEIEVSWDKIAAQPGSPLVNRALALYPPGSVMKVVTSLALLRSGVSTTELYECTGSILVNGQTVSDNGVHGPVNYKMALAKSCNSYFAASALKAGDQSFLTAVKAFGFGQDIPLELAVPPSTIINNQLDPKRLDPNLLAASSFGQGQVLISPLHMALISAAIANDGIMMVPHLVQQVKDAKDKVLYQAPVKAWLTVLTSQEAETITEAMVAAVTSGTAARGALPYVQVAAKTGSAEPGGNAATHAWYIAFAPADDPQIALAVIIENGGSGGEAAAPIARNLIDKALSRKVGNNK
jgi:peptidoglycan glycosyltransferase